MLEPIYTTRFKKDYKKVLRQGKDKKKFEDVATDLLMQKPLDPKLKNHPLKGNYTDRNGIHLEPDWILIYKNGNGFIIFERTGSHSDLFK